MDYPPLRTVTAGYRALREAAAWLDLPGRGRIRAVGEDAARLLHAMSTNQVEELKPGQGCYAFFLNAQGRILADANLLRGQGYFVIDTEPELATKLYEHLDRYIIADDVTLEDETASTATLAVEGPRAAEVLAQLGMPVPADDGDWTVWEDGLVARISTTGAGGFLATVPAGRKPALVEGLAETGVPEASAEEARVVRIENARPRYGEEITDRYLIQETAQLRAVSFTKGCYLGQEIVERVRSRGQVHRQLRAIEMESFGCPPPGAKLAAVTSEGEKADAAEVASAAYSPGLGKTVGLAYVRTPFLDAGAGFRWEEVAVRLRPPAS